MRVQIPAYTDRWMMGDHYGDVVKVSRQRPKHAVRASLLTRHPHASHEIAHVKLDKSGKTVRVILDDCTVVS
jgi:hypothetical protein